MRSVRNTGQVVSRSGGTTPTPNSSVQASVDTPIKFTASLNSSLRSSCRPHKIGRVFGYQYVWQENGLSDEPGFARILTDERSFDLEDLKGSGSLSSHDFEAAFVCESEETIGEDTLRVATAGFMPAQIHIVHPEHRYADIALNGSKLFPILVSCIYGRYRIVDLDTTGLLFDIGHPSGNIALTHVTAQDEPSPAVFNVTNETTGQPHGGPVFNMVGDTDSSNTFRWVDDRFEFAIDGNEALPAQPVTDLDQYIVDWEVVVDATTRSEFNDSESIELTGGGSLTVWIQNAFSVFAGDTVSVSSDETVSMGSVVRVDQFNFNKVRLRFSTLLQEPVGWFRDGVNALTNTDSNNRFVVNGTATIRRFFGPHNNFLPLDYRNDFVPYADRDWHWGETTEDIEDRDDCPQVIVVENDDSISQWNFLTNGETIDRRTTLDPLPPNLPSSFFLPTNNSNAEVTVTGSLPPGLSIARNGQITGTIDIGTQTSPVSGSFTLNLRSRSYRLQSEEIQWTVN